MGSSVRGKMLLTNNTLNSVLTKTDKQEEYYLKGQINRTFERMVFAICDYLTNAFGHKTLFGSVQWRETNTE